MSITIKLLDSVRSIENKVNTAIAEQANSLINRSNTKAKSEIYAFVERCIVEQPEIASLKAGGQGSLAAQFGIPVGQESSVTDSIVAAIVAATKVGISRFNRNLQGKIEISFQPADFTNLLALPTGSVHTELGVKLDWLHWLLQEGSRIIIVGYEYVSNSSGRSRGGVMKTGESWRVPTQFAGTAGDNFITRAFSNRENELQNLLGSFLGSNFK
jgi:hypothetical protein